MACNYFSVNLGVANGYILSKSIRKLTARENVSNPGSSRVDNVDDSGLKIDRNGQVHKKINPICSLRWQTYVSHREPDPKTVVIAGQIFGAFLCGSWIALWPNTTQKCAAEGQSRFS